MHLSGERASPVVQVEPASEYTSRTKCAGAARSLPSSSEAAAGLPDELYFGLSFEERRSRLVGPKGLMQQLSELRSERASLRSSLAFYSLE